MSNNRIVFIPWKKGTLGIWRNTRMDEFERDVWANNLQVDFTHHKFNWTLFYIDSPDQPLSTIGCEKNTRIHVAGHGDIGDPNIYPPGIDLTTYSSGSPLSPVRCKEIVQGLIYLGLPKEYSGKITCDVCYSALGTNMRPPFARLLADELWSQGFKAVCVVGYKGGLFSTYSETDSNSRLFFNERRKTKEIMEKEKKWQANDNNKFDVEELKARTEINNLRVDKINPGINDTNLRMRNTRLKNLGIEEKFPKWNSLTSVHDMAAAERGVIGKFRDNYRHRVVHMNEGTPNSVYVTAKNAQMLFKASDNEAIFYPLLNKE